MQGKKTKTAKLSFDDRNLPPNKITRYRAEEIERVAKPLLSEMLEKLRGEKPELFRSSSDKK
jgi:hypothetical protein